MKPSLVIALFLSAAAIPPDPEGAMERTSTLSRIRTETRSRSSRPS